MHAFTKTVALAIALLSFSPVHAQDKTNGKGPKQHRIKSVYLSWGYNQEWYTKSTVHVQQDALGSNYDMVDVKAHDHMGWNNKSIFKQAITIPQYNYRIGFFINRKEDLAIEVNFDHTKYIISNEQDMRVKGKLFGKNIDSNVHFSESNNFYYFLNNGANFFLFNIVKRVGLYQFPQNKARLDLTLKAGVGPLTPHVQNKLFNVANDPHFQIGGWNTGIETALRLTAAKRIFFELSQKVDYARYSHLWISDNGRINQAFGTYELIFTFGFILPTSKNDPYFGQGVTNHDLFGSGKGATKG